MTLSGEVEINATRDSVFRTLLNPEALKRCLPGCERLESIGENSYAVTISAGVGAIKGTFTGTATISESEPPSHVRLVIEGKGQPGFLKGSGTLDLEDAGEKTLIRYGGEVLLGGLIAGVGQRMIQGAAQMMATRFFAAVEAESRVVTPEHPNT